LYTHLLVPTDGSTLSLKAARVAADLAKTLGARITALYVIPPFAPAYTVDPMFPAVTVTEKDYLYGMRGYADKALARVAAIAAKQQIPCEQQSPVYPTPWEGIIKSAGKNKCDLIVMSSHGRSGIAGVVLGSQAHRVLAHSKIPVLVCR
jgi:nucleotide-binding universal stress UspA family protein